MPFGVAGGKSAAPNEVKYRSGNEEFVPPLRSKYEKQPLKAGDLVMNSSPGGGGFGNPLARALESVELDLNLGYISRATAERDYGAVIAEDAAGRRVHALHAGHDGERKEPEKSGSDNVSAHNSDGAWELPHEFRQMQTTARRFMRERVVPAEAPLPHDAYALPDDVLKPLQEEARRLGFWNVELPAEWGGAGLNLLGQAVVAEESSQCKMGLYIAACHAFGWDPPNAIFLGRKDQIEKYAVPTTERRRQDVRRDLGSERRLRSGPRDQDARREEGRPLHPQRHQDLDLGRRAVGLGAGVRAHRPEQGPRRRHLVHRREEVQGLQLQADPGDPLVLPLRDQLRGLRSAGGKPPRRRGRGLQARRDLADPRAHSLCGGGDRRRAGGARNSRSTGPSSAKPSARSSPTSRRSSG